MTQFEPSTAHRTLASSPGRVYPRAELHKEWNGSTRLQQEGILTPREVLLIIVVTGEEGPQYPCGIARRGHSGGHFPGRLEPVFA